MTHLVAIAMLTIQYIFVPVKSAESGISKLRCEFLPNPKGIDDPHPRFSWNVEGTDEDVIQKRYKLTVFRDSQERIVVWHVTKSSTSEMLRYDGPSLQPFTQYYWKVSIRFNKGESSTSNIASFETGMMGQTNWKGTWITDHKDIHLTNAPYYRKQFIINKPIKSARAYISTAGLYELYFNGQKTGDHYMDPMYTRFDRRNLYVTYDVTQQLQQGQNAIGVLLGNGWYNMQTVAPWYFDRAPWRARPSLLMDLRITYTDGSTEIICTDESWKTAISNLSYNNIYTGEHIDGRREVLNWNKAGYDDSGWDPVTVTGAPSQHIVSQTLYPIRKAETIYPVVCTKLNDTDYVYDLGRSISGISQVIEKGESGTVIRLKHGEKLYPNGHVDISNIAVGFFELDPVRPLVTDEYILSGNGTETFAPRFSYKGFRYIEVTSTKPIKLSKENLVAYFTHSDVPKIGTISSSDTIISQLWRATCSSYLANLQGYPTDCPQREKNGWTGDVHMAIEAGLYNFDAITIYEKWLADIRDEQQPNGLFPAINPSSGWGYTDYNNVDWLSALIIVPWELYRFYGDSKALQNNYEAMDRYMDFLDRTHPDGIIREGLGDRERMKHQADTGLTSTCYYYNDAMIMAKTAKLFNRKTDEAHYSALAEKIRIAFNQKYYHDRNYAHGYQTENSYPLYWGLVPDNKRAAVAKSLAESVTRDSLHLDIGIMGNVALLNALSQNGYADVAYHLAIKTTYPSWGYWMTKGMTTLPETWNMKTSLSHIFMGEISAWFYKGLGGIFPDDDDPGFHHIVLRPHIPVGLKKFSAEHLGAYGKIVSAWKTTDNSIVYTAAVPTNSSADLVLTVHGKLVCKRHLNSGKYHFIYFER